MGAGGGISSDQGGNRRRLNERAWRELFKRFEGAGLTVEAFCQRERLSRSSFNRCRSRLPLRTGAAAAAAVGACDDRQLGKRPSWTWACSARLASQSQPVWSCDSSWAAA